MYPVRVSIVSVCTYRWVMKQSHIRNTRYRRCSIEPKDWNLCPYIIWMSRKTCSSDMRKVVFYTECLCNEGIDLFIVQWKQILNYVYSLFIPRHTHTELHPTHSRTGGTPRTPTTLRRTLHQLPLRKLWYSSIFCILFLPVICGWHNMGQWHL